MKYVKIIAALFLSLCLWGFLFCVLIVTIIYLGGKYPQTAIVDIGCKDENGLYQLVVPVQIGDDTYNFLWDTGSSYSFISPFLADELNLSMKEKITLTNIQTVYKPVSESFGRQKLNFQVGEFFMDATFLSDENFSVPCLNYTKDSKIKGVIGQNVINLCHWLFDFKNCQVSLSTTPFSLDMEDMEVLVLPFIDSGGGVPLVDVKIDNKDTVQFNFDTGNQNVFVLSGNTLYPSFKLQDSIVNSLDVQNKAYLKSGIKYKGIDQLVVCDTLNLNDFRFENFILSNLNTYNQTNYITVNFVFQFDQMYYNPFDKEITLIRHKDKHPSIDDIGGLVHHMDSIKNIMQQDPTISVLDSRMEL